VVLCLVVLVAVACGPVTAVPTPTEIIKPTNTVVPTHTSLPEPSPTATLSQVDKSFIEHDPEKAFKIANVVDPF
jgi:hypothetical protein